MTVSRILRSLRRDDGVALPAVIGIGIVITLLVMTGAAISTSGAVKTFTDGNSLNAMQAAYAGAADYQSRLTNNNNYWQYGAGTSFTGTSTFPLGTGSNPAFGTTTGGNWATVNGSNGLETYRYEVNNSKFATTGAVQLRVTGRSGNQTRSLVATVRGTGFIDYLYFTDYESSNPALTGETQNGNNSLSCLSVHMTDPSYSTNTACDPVQFRAGDVLAGPIRTNDEFTICGATFNQTVQSTAADGVYNRPGGCGAPTFGQASPTSPQPAHVGTLIMPQTNQNMIQATRSDINVTPGCLYTGPTSISFNSDGSMQIISPWSKATQVTMASDGVTYTGGTMAAICGSLSDLSSSTGARVTLSANLIFVQSVPGTTTSDPNYWAAGSQPSSPGSGAVVCSKSTTSHGVTTTTYGNGLISPLTQNYPSPTEYVGSVGNLSTASPYYCRNGDAFVSGTFHGALTIGAQNNLYVVGSITYADSTNDILGLVGQQEVAVWNPRTSGGTLLKYASGANVTINAAIASNGGTFTVQNYAYGSPLGTLTVLGSIAQEWRGAVGTSAPTGFTKSYGYDQRLKNTAPPKFLQPVTTAFSISQQVEVSAAYKSDGTSVP